MMTAKLFMGCETCSVEPGGALSLPGFVRAPLGLDTVSATLFLGSHESEPCLTGYSGAQALALQQDCRRRRLAEEGIAPAAYHALARRLFGLMHRVEIEIGGRLILPELLRRRARIRDTVLIVGTGEGFEIWSPEVALDGADEGMRALAALALEISQAA